MSRDDFEKDLGDYLRTRKKAGFDIKALFQNLIPKKEPEQVTMPEEVEVYHSEDKPREPKQRVLAKIFKKQEPANEELLRTKMQCEDTIEDLKEIAKISLGMVKQLPDEQLRQFKNSPDFDKMKSILKKHELIK